MTLVGNIACFNVHKSVDTCLGVYKLVYINIPHLIFNFTLYEFMKYHHYILIYIVISFNLMI